MMSELSEKDRDRLRRLLLEGAESPPSVTADANFFDQLRERAREGQARSLNEVLADITANGGGLRMVDRITRESTYDRHAR